jgi:hypothetical protein
MLPGETGVLVFIEHGAPNKGNGPSATGNSR